MLATGRYDYERVATNDEARAVLYPMGECEVEWSDKVGEEGEVLVLTRFTIFVFSKGWGVVRKIGLRSVERVTWDPDGLVLMVNTADDNVKPFLTKVSEGSRRYHLHTLLREFYEDETLEPLPSIVAPCNLPHEYQRKNTLIQIHRASLDLPPDCITQLTQHIHQATCNPTTELQTLQEIHSRLLSNTLFHLQTPQHVLADIQNLEYTAVAAHGMAGEARDEVSKLTEELAMLEVEAAGLRRERDVFKECVGNIDRMKVADDKRAVTSLESYTRKLLMAESNSRLAGLQLASVRAASSALIRQREIKLAAAAERTTNPERNLHNIQNHLKKKPQPQQPPVVVRSKISLTDLLSPAAEQRPATPLTASQRQKTEERLREWRSKLLKHT